MALETWIFVESSWANLVLLPSLLSAEGEQYPIPSRAGDAKKIEDLLYYSFFQGAANAASTHGERSPPRNIWH